MYQIDKQLIQRESEKVMYNIMESLQTIVDKLNEKSNVNLSKENNAVKSNKRICKICNEEFEGQGQLLKHINLNHKKGGK